MVNWRSSESRIAAVLMGKIFATGPKASKCADFFATLHADFRIATARQQSVKTRFNVTFLQHFGWRSIDRDAMPLPGVPLVGTPRVDGIEGPCDRSNKVSRKVKKPVGKPDAWSRVSQLRQNCLAFD